MHPGIPARFPGAPLVWTTALIAVLVLVLGGCKGEYEPPGLPLSLEWGPDGLQITPEAKVVTPLGAFTIGADLPPAAGDSFLLVVRQATPDGPRDLVYRVDEPGSAVDVLVNGTTVVRVAGRQVFLDATRGEIQSIEFRPAAPAAARQGANHFAEQWRKYWEDCWYTPLALASWAYDDSPVDGFFDFVWFVIRLALAIALGLLDALLTVGCALAGAAYMFYGPAGRNIAYGLEILAIPFLPRILRWVTRLF
ncbi:hypothetical protein Nocox_31100 [Nonomuraea coxensis DSM 45129]|uniref:Uncharacterized protein n=1 Tax=Nonomuraea coxensis DSM 45129 TaxID=1122611 RepID=A0ABX8UA36_9ACTN|nr:hypothetical protein [Nonomuraea coxensis]QYC43801.1 hypothetical protein Nocox_31100 [Nonomuraea coxensis DSM 45129]